MVPAGWVWSRQILHARRIIFQRTRTWRESHDHDLVMLMFWRLSQFTVDKLDL
jgi:hypothetical protein